MKPPKWPRAPLSSASTGSNSFNATWAQRKHGVSPPNLDSAKAAFKPKPKPQTGFSQLRDRIAPSIDANAAKGQQQEEWPLLKRRNRPAAETRSSQTDASAHGAKRSRPPHRRHGSQPPDFDLAAALARAGSTKAEFAAQRGLSSSFARAEIDWSKLESASPLAGDFQDGRDEGILEEEIAAQKALEADSKKNMLLIRAVSKSLSASDFHRIAPKGLSAWSSGIKKVEQQRDPHTLRPLGCYQVSFISSHAAQSYASNLNRLQRLAHHKFSSDTGLWQATVPDHLLRPNCENTPDDIAEDLAALTLSTPTRRALDVKKSRTTQKYPWARELQSLVQKCGYGERPAVAVVSITPGLISGEHLSSLIRQDGLRRDLAWKASKPIPLNLEKKARHLSARAKALEDEAGRAKAKAAADEDEAPELPEVRYVLAFESDWEARSFHRSWHQRVLVADQTGIEGRAMANVEVIEW